MKVLNILLLAYFAFFTHPLFAGEEETNAAKEECTQAANDYGIVDAERKNYITECIEEIILDDAEALKETPELEVEQSGGYDSEQTSN